MLHSIYTIEYYSAIDPEGWCGGQGGGEVGRGFGIGNMCTHMVDSC